MVDVSLVSRSEVLPPHCYVALRVGDTQKIGRANTERLYKFSKAAAGEHQYGTLDVFQRLSSATVSINPKDGDQDVKLNSRAGKMNFCVTAKAASDEKSAIVKKIAQEANLKPKLQAAQAYLAKHNLELRLKEAMQRVILELPEDPVSFITERLRESEGIVTRKAPDFTPQPRAAADVATGAAADVATGGTASSSTDVATGAAAGANVATGAAGAAVDVAVGAASSSTDVAAGATDDRKVSTPSYSKRPARANEALPAASTEQANSDPAEAAAAEQTLESMRSDIHSLVKESVAQCVNNEVKSEVSRTAGELRQQMQKHDQQVLQLAVQASHLREVVSDIQKSLTEN